MSRLPEKEQEFLTWAANHLTVWAGQSTPPNIGVTSEQITAAQAKLAAAQDALAAALVIRQESTSVTEDKDQKVEDLRATIGGLVTQIEGYAKATGDAGVYVRAQFAPPKPREPRTEAPVPTNLDLQSTTNGNLVLTFEANKGTGSVFVIQRSIKPIGGEEQPFVYMDTTAEKTWTDTSVPSGLDWVSYQVATKLTNGVRSDWANAERFNFGTFGNQSSAQAQASAKSGGGGGGGDGGPDGLTIDDAQKLKNAQTAKGKGQAG
jgi:hypothetical protein